MKKLLRSSLVAFATLSVLPLHPSSLLAQSTAFTYQGRLNDGASPATGTYDFRFAIYDVLSGGGAIAAPVTNSATVVSNGLFAVALDFGNQFPGANRWLEIGVRTNGAASFFTLSPRQALTPAPYAITAGNLVSGGLAAGTYGNAVTLNNSGNQLAGSFSGNGAGVTNVNAATLNGLTSSNFWQLGGNAGVASGQFIGTTDTNALNLKVNGKTALQIVSGTTLPNVVGGLAGTHPSFLASGVSGAVIAGGNAPSGGVTGFGGGDFQAVYDNDGTVGGGFGNKVGSNNGDLTDAAFATVAGGVFNSATNYAAAVCGGDGNLSGGSRAFVGAGFGNIAAGNFSVLGGGLQNLIQPGAERAVIGGGGGNVIALNATYATIAGGSANSAGSVVTNSLTIGTTIAGGVSNRADCSWSFIGGGKNNLINDLMYTIFGTAVTVSPYAAIVGGEQNNVGASPLAPSNAADHSAIGGGYGNAVWSASQSVISGGGNNLIYYGNWSAIPGGQSNEVDGYWSLAAGQRAKAYYNGNFVWADSQNADFASTAGNQFLIRAAAGVGINTNNPQAALHVVGNILATGTITGSSDVNAKENFVPVNPREVLDRVAALPITRWNYREDKAETHLGPMAQDFYAAFALGMDDRHISMVDADGVALAAIQGLNEKVEGRSHVAEARIQKLEAENAELKQHNDALEKRLDALEKIVRNQKSH